MNTCGKRVRLGLPTSMYDNELLKELTLCDLLREAARVAPTRCVDMVFIGRSQLHLEEQVGHEASQNSQ